MQFDTVNGLLAGAAHWPTICLAYGLATAWHEARFEPVEEIGKGRGKAYGKPGKYGQSQHGRGLVQVTWDSNYEWLDAAAAEAGLITPSSEEHTSELQSLMRISYAVLCVKKKRSETDQIYRKDY